MIKNEINKQGYQYIVWGLGKRGKRYVDGCDKSKIKAIIDNNSELSGKYFEGIPIIDYSSYRNNYSEYDILVTVKRSDKLLLQLDEDNIKNYFLLSECPYEFLGYCGKFEFSNLPLNIKTGKRYLIYGLSLYSFLLKMYLQDELNIKATIVAEHHLKYKAFSEKYSYVKNENNIIYSDYDCVLIACNPRRNRCIIPLPQKDIYDFSWQIKEYRCDKIKNFKNKYRGEKCFIIGNGPSLNPDDLDMIRTAGYMSFGTNRIYKIFDKTSWKPDYLVSADEIILKGSFDDIFSCGVQNIIIGDTLQNRIDEARHLGAMVVHSIPYIDLRYLEEFSSEIECCVFEGGTITYMCIQIAVYMGFKTIYLLGVDNSNSNSQENAYAHFCQDYYGGTETINPPLFDEATLAYESARKYAGAHDIKIYNATRGGKLEVFERIDFDSIFK